MRSSYLNLKHNAKRRKIAFDLTFKEFKQFCQRTKYLAFKGRQFNGFTVDRIDSSIGYCLVNMQVLQNRDNVRKMMLERRGGGYKYEVCNTEGVDAPF